MLIEEIYINIINTILNRQKMENEEREIMNLTKIMWHTQCIKFDKWLQQFKRHRLDITSAFFRINNHSK